MPGVKTTYVKDGMTVTFLDGVLHTEVPVGDTGTARYYHPNGALAAEVPLKHGRTHGISRVWHENGQPKSETNYVYGMVVGVSRTWEPDGSLLMESNYIVPDLEGSLAIHGRIYADKGHIHSVYLWNGAALSKARWTKKVLATGMTESELEQKLAAGPPAQPPGTA
jgi:MORN repeat variant